MAIVVILKSKVSYTGFEVDWQSAQGMIW